MGYVFISYCSKNQVFADSINNFFKQKGIETWIAPNDIPPGSTYASVIINAIQNCSCFVLLLTTESQDSEHVNKEVERAIHYKKTIIPIVQENVTLNDCFEYYLCNQQIIAISKISDDSLEVKRLMDCILTFVDSKSQISKNETINQSINNNSLNIILNCVKLLLKLLICSINLLFHIIIGLLCILIWT